MTVRPGRRTLPSPTSYFYFINAPIENQLKAEKESVTASFRSLYKTLQEQQSTLTAAESDLAMAQKTFSIQQTKYESGMISELDYIEAQETLAAAEEAAITARTDLLTAYNDYQWAIRGVMTQD